jgi:hypothetical protein
MSLPIEEFNNRISLAAGKKIERESKLKLAIDRLVIQYNLPPLAKGQLWDCLSKRPPDVYARELEILEGNDPEFMDGRLTIDNDVAAILVKGNADATYNSLSESEKRKARNYLKYFGTKKILFRCGKPPYPYRQLIEHYANCICKETKILPKISRSVTTNGNEKSGQPQGVWFNTIMAALELALFASGPPPRETVYDILKEYRRMHIRNPPE